MCVVNANSFLVLGFVVVENHPEMGGLARHSHTWIKRWWCDFFGFVVDPLTEQNFSFFFRGKKRDAEALNKFREWPWRALFQRRRPMTFLSWTCIPVQKQQHFFPFHVFVWFLPNPMWPSSGVSKSPSPWFFRMLNSTWVESHLRVFSLHTPLVHERRDAQKLIATHSTS